MRKLERPYAYFPSFQDIPLSFYDEEGIKVIFSDLDNTLAPYYVALPDEEVIASIKKLTDHGLTVYIASNNHSKRVTLFAEKLGIGCLSWLFKPFGHRLRKAMKKLGIKPEEACLIGDQIATDVKAGNRAKIKTIYVEPLVEKDPIWTIVNRRLERGKREKIRSLGVKGVIKYE